MSSSSSPSSTAFSAAPTSATPWVIESCVLLTAPVLASLYLVWYYTREIMHTTRPRCALPIIFVAFVTTLSPVGLLVLDISYAQDSDAARSSPVIAAGWTTLFWATQALSWVILPVLQEYCQSGHFSTGRKLWDSVKLNVLLYVGMGLVLGALLLYAVFVKGEGVSLTNCVGVAIASSNAFGLLLIILFLGYGLAQVPRALWFHSTRSNTLRLNRWTAVDLHEGLETRRLEWSDLLRHVSQSRDAIVAAASESGGDALRAGLAAVQGEIDTLHGGGSGGGLRPSAAAAYIDSEGFSDLGDVTELPGLVRLHQRVKRTRGALEATAFQWETLVDETTRLEEYERLSGEGASAAAAAAAGVGGLAGALSLRYNLRMKRVVLRLLAAAAAAASGMLVFSFGVALPVDRAISPVRLLVMETPPALRHAAVLTLFPYAVLCCYWSLFRFKLFSFHLLVPRHSDPANLCFTATFLCRLIIPLCYSFANVCGLVGAKGAKLAYTKAVVANMNTVDLLGENFNRYMPCLLLVVFLGTATDLLQRLLNCVGIAVFTFGGQDKLDKDRIDEGASAIHAEASSAGAAVRRRAGSGGGQAGATRMRRLRGSGGGSDDDDEEEADAEARL